MSYSLRILLFFCFFSVTFSSSGQRRFVLFETTSGKDSVCQGKPVGIIVKLVPGYENYKSFVWTDDQGGGGEIKNELVKINTANSGLRKLRFTLELNTGERLDTVVLLNILPKPTVTIQLKSNEIRLKPIKNSVVISYRWMYNGSIVDEFVSQPYKNPKVGTYSVIVKDNRGCNGSSNLVKIE